MSRVVVYMRVSTNKQEVANQKFEIVNFCKKKDIHPTEWIEEVMSGAADKKDRKITPVLEGLKKGDALIVTEISRLSRSLFHIMEILQYCLQTGVQIYTVKEGYVLKDDIQSKVMAFAFGIAAEIERNLISQRTKEGLARRKSEGVILGRPKGRKSNTLKLTGQEEEIQRLLSKKLSVSAIGRLLGVHRMTLKTFIQDNELR